MTFPSEVVAVLAVRMREAGGALLAGRDSEFIDRLEDTLYEAKSAARRATRGGAGL